MVEIACGEPSATTWGQHDHTVKPAKTTTVTSVPSVPSKPGVDHMRGAHTRTVELHDVQITAALSTKTQSLLASIEFHVVLARDHVTQDPHRFMESWKVDQHPPGKTVLPEAETTGSFSVSSSLAPPTVYTTFFHGTAIDGALWAGQLGGQHSATQQEAQVRGGSSSETATRVNDGVRRGLHS